MQKISSTLKTSNWQCLRRCNTLHISTCSRSRSGRSWCHLGRPGSWEFSNYINHSLKKVMKTNLNEHHIYEHMYIEIRCLLQLHFILLQFLRDGIFWRVPKAGMLSIYIRRFHTEVTSKPWRSSIAFIKSSSCWSTCWASKSNWSIPSSRVLQLHFRELTSDLILRAILDRPYEDVKTQMLRYIQQAI